MDNTNSRIPNIIYSDGNTTIGYLKTHQDFLDFNVENEYCIRRPQRFAAYQRMGYSLYIIDNGLEEDFLRYAVLQILNRTGERTYWGMDDLPMTESGKREFEQTLTPQSLDFINKLCENAPNNNRDNNQNINCNLNMNKKLIRLTESDLHRIVKESVNRILKEDGIPSVSYLSKFGKMGTHYNQTIKIGLTQEDLDALNSKLVGMADTYDTPDENGLVSANPMLNGHEMVSKNLRTTLQFGKNHLTLSQLYALAELLNWKEYKRVKMDRNTILLVVRI